MHMFYIQLVYMGIVKPSYMVVPHLSVLPEDPEEGGPALRVGDGGQVVGELRQDHLHHVVKFA